jgi:hypothetical protein
MKRVRMDDLTIDDVLYFGRLVMENDPFKERAPSSEGPAFRAMFGCSQAVVLDLYNKLVSNDLLPDGGKVKHLLWALMYAKQYAKWVTMRKLTNTDPKTLRLWIHRFFDAIASLEPEIVSILVDCCLNWICD